MRRERDSLGAKAVPSRALYGIFTQRARETFQLTGRPPHPALIRAYALVKKAAARANAALGVLPRRSARAIEAAADRVAAGRIPDVAVLDSLHAGAGTPIHMNVNEVIANLANERLGGRIGLGGTAVGAGLTAHPRFRSRVVRELSRLVGQRLTPATSTVTTTWSLRPLLACSAALRGVAVDVAKICADLRLLASGPHTGFGELSLPEVEPGSSIMPGKVNRSVPEAVQMACYQVCGYDHAIALAAAAGE